MPLGRHDVETALATSFTMIAFAANSILCRLALGTESIDPATFTSIRIASGAALLVAVAAARGRARPPAPPRAPWTSAAFLALYAAGFSFAYGTLDAGTGALLLFGAVQATMILAALRAGERFRLLEGLGLALALAGLAALVSPGIRAPDPAGSALMLGAGIAWGFYSLRGRGVRDPLGDTARNFAAAIPAALVLSLATLPAAHVAPRGLAIAIVSGAVTSGLGYVLWTYALRRLTSIRAAIVQLAVPALAAGGGVLLLGEPMSLRLLVSGAMILGGVAISVVGRQRQGAPRD